MVPPTAHCESPYVKALTDTVPLVATPAAVFDKYHLNSRQGGHLVLMGSLVARSKTDLVVRVSQHTLLIGLKEIE
jgi:hypothetical protein